MLRINGFHLNVCIGLVGLKVTPLLLLNACLAKNVQALFWPAVNMSLYAPRRHPCRQGPKLRLH